MHVFFAIDADHLSRDKVGVRRGQKKLRREVLLDRFGDRKARHHDIDRDPVFAELQRNAARKPMIPALAAA